MSEFPAHPNAEAIEAEIRSEEYAQLRSELARVIRERDDARAWSNKWESLSDMQSKCIASIESSLASSAQAEGERLRERCADTVHAVIGFLYDQIEYGFRQWWDAIPDDVRWKWYDLLDAGDMKYSRLKRDRKLAVRALKGEGDGK
jgi:hypothetical protein